MQLISLRLGYAQKICSGGRRILPCEGGPGGPLAVSVTCVVTTAVTRGDRRIVSLVWHQMMHSGGNRSDVGPVSAWFVLLVLLLPPVARAAAGKAAALKGMERVGASLGQALAL